jgi:p-aminobenzoyl-glutamate transporter AbgT
MESRSMLHNYYFVAYFIIANLFLLNVLIGFIIDNIVEHLSETTEPKVQTTQEKDELKVTEEEFKSVTEENDLK